MTTAELYELMENPSGLSEETLPVLKQVVDDYPFFHTARMLYLKNLSLLNDLRFDAVLKKMAVHIPDRRKLFMWIEGERYGLSLHPDDGRREEKEDAFSLVDSYLSSHVKKEEEMTSLSFYPSASSDYMYWTLTKEKSSFKEEEGAKLQHADLIDSFIANDTPRVLLSEEDSEREKGALPEPDESDDLRQKPVEDTYFTETLARIYVKQKRYEKALQIIKKLSLKYPEKNSYFADQIRFLEKLIINTKKIK